MFNLIIFAVWAIFLLVMSTYNFLELINDGWSTTLFHKFLRNNYSIVVWFLVFSQDILKSVSFWFLFPVLLWQCFLDMRESL